MEDSGATMRLRRLADAFEVLALGTTGLTIDRDTRAPAGAVSWQHTCSFRVRLAGGSLEGAHVSLYVRAQGEELEAMSGSAVPAGGVIALDDSIGVDVARDYQWGIIRFRNESDMAETLLKHMRRRLWDLGAPRN
ncbi:MAG TPA: hypothetical protein VFQ38_06985 [Longimicrobiales bacterium]|nr:hypothetical protein [Longimicrobiales bacterium]